MPQRKRWVFRRVPNYAGNAILGFQYEQFAEVGPESQVEERAGRYTLLLIVPMSSGRLSLDRVGRHQSPSPFHRHGQSNTHTQMRGCKGDIFTLR